MTTFTLTVQDRGVHDALAALAERVGSMEPHLKALGDDIIARTQRRFDTSSGPDGEKWQANSAATLMTLGERLVGHRNKKGERSYAYSKQGGRLNGKGLDRLANKKPLIDQGDLRRQFFREVTGNNVLTVRNSQPYAAIQQFGGKAGRGHKVTIPARPFLPVQLDGTLYPQEQALVLAALNAFLAEGL